MAIVFKSLNQAKSLGDFVQEGFSSTQTTMKLLPGTRKAAGELANLDYILWTCEQYEPISGAVSKRWMVDTSTYLKLLSSCMPRILEL